MGRAEDDAAAAARVGAEPCEQLTAVRVSLTGAPLDRAASPGGSRGGPAREPEQRVSGADSGQRRDSLVLAGRVSRGQQGARGDDLPPEAGRVDRPRLARIHR